MFDTDDLYTLEEVQEACALSASASFQKGRAVERDSLLSHMRFAVELNGNGDKMLKALETLTKGWTREGLGGRGEGIEKAWDESKVHRDHGKFAEKDGLETSSPEIADLEGKLREQHTARADELQASADSGRAMLEREMAKSGMTADHPLAQMMLAQIALLEQYAKERRELAGTVGKAFDESKVKRDHGRFATTEGTGAEALPADTRARTLARDLLHELYEAEGESLPPPGLPAGPADDPPASDDDDLDDADATLLADDPDALRELLAAAVAHTEACLADGRDPQGGLDALADLAGDELEEVAGGTFEKAAKWDESLHPRGRNGRFIGRDRIQAAQSDPELANKLREEVKPEDAEKLEDALSGKSDVGKTQRGAKKHAAKEKREAKHASRAEALQIRNRLFGQHQRGEPLDPADLRALVPHLSTMTQAELSDVRLFLAGAGASLGGKRLREERVERLADWANAQAEGEKEEAPKAEEKPVEKPTEGEPIPRQGGLKVGDVVHLPSTPQRSYAGVSGGTIVSVGRKNVKVRVMAADDFTREKYGPHTDYTVPLGDVAGIARDGVTHEVADVPEPTPPATTSTPPSQAELAAEITAARHARRGAQSGADDSAPSEAEFAAASGAKPAALDPAEVYDRSGSTAKHSEVNAALRHVAQMTPAAAKVALAKMDFPPTGDPRRQLADLLYDRKAAQLRGLHAGLGREADARVQAAYKPLDDEPLLAVDEAFADAKPAAEAKPAKGKKPRGEKPKADAKPAQVAADLADALRQKTGSARQRAWQAAHDKHGEEAVSQAATATGHEAWEFGRGAPVSLFRDKERVSAIRGKLEAHAGQGTAPVLDLANPQALANAVHGIGDSLPNWMGQAHDPAATFFPHKVVIADLYDALKPQLGSASLEDFKAALSRANRAGTLGLADVDMPQYAANPEAVTRSRIALGNFVAVEMPKVRKPAS